MSNTAGPRRRDNSDGESANGEGGQPYCKKPRRLTPPVYFDVERAGPLPRAADAAGSWVNGTAAASANVGAVNGGRGNRETSGRGENGRKPRNGGQGMQSSAGGTVADHPARSAAGHRGVPVPADEKQNGTGPFLLPDAVKGEPIVPPPAAAASSALGPPAVTTSDTDAGSISASKQPCAVPSVNQPGQATSEPPRHRSHRLAEDYISLASNLLLPSIDLGPFGYDASSGHYPIERATALGLLTSPLRRPTVVERWNPYEICVFEASLALYGKDFHRVAKCIGTKCTKECVEFYYIWKKTDHYRVWKRGYGPDLESDSDEE